MDPLKTSTYFIVAAALIAYSSGAIVQTDISSSTNPNRAAEQMLFSNYDKPEEKPVERMNRRAVEAIQAADWEKAFKHLMEGIKEDPTYVETYNNFGMAHSVRKEYPSAEKAYQKALEVDPQNAKAAYNYSKILIIKGDQTLAYKMATDAAANSDPKEWKYYSWLATLQSQKSEFVKAVESYASAIEFLNQRLDTVTKAISNEEFKEEVVEQWTDTEIVTEFGGVTREVEVQRFRTERKNAPDAWHELKASLEKQRDELFVLKATAEKASS